MDCTLIFIRYYDKKMFTLTKHYKKKKKDTLK